MLVRTGGAAIAIQQIEAVIQRLSSDPVFRVQYCQNPDRTLEAYLSPDEMRALKGGDGHRFAQLGYGERWEDLTAALCGPNPAD